ncbi:MAG: 2,3-bisphosphoglycerate-independent phosphoglycerate mutase [Desulfobulbaceae bacterium]|nr:MAG: 2,3-bisphosphoglycerate-independent phosphoglycerate mutase [Desulfobulbaceae bacterium]
MTTEIRPVLLAILDGWGEAASGPGNAVRLAATPNIDRWRREYPFTTLVAHGEAVGLPAGQMGNSEVGHLNIGAGRVVYQDFNRINLAVRNGDFFVNKTLNATISTIKCSGGTLHLMGLLSDAGVHSHLDHLVALLELAAYQGLERAQVHAFMDGRDSAPDGGLGYMETLLAALQRIGIGRVATVCGRYYAMDRDKRWDRVARAWAAVVDGQGQFVVTDPLTAVREAYARGETDEFIKPTVVITPTVVTKQSSTVVIKTTTVINSPAITRPTVVTEPTVGNFGSDQAGAGAGRINDGDGVIFFNFRADRARQLTAALIRDDFSGFARSRRPRLSAFATMTRYEKNFDLPVAFPPDQLTHILGEEVSRHGLRQLRIAETEKYAHVTYFFNGGREEPFSNEDRVLIPSPRDVATYDLKPEMSAPEITMELLDRLSGKTATNRLNPIDRPNSTDHLNPADHDLAEGGKKVPAESATESATVAERAAAPPHPQAGDVPSGAKAGVLPYALVILNFANGDMVGHSGIIPAAIKACEAVDYCLGRIVEAFTAAGGIVLITADHGNAEEMTNGHGGPVTAHSCNPVPFILIDRQIAATRHHLRGDGALANIAPTILQLMGLPTPTTMTSPSLLLVNNAK